MNLVEICPRPTAENQRMGSFITQTLGVQGIISGGSVPCPLEVSTRLLVRRQEEQSPMGSLMSATEGTPGEATGSHCPFSESPRLGVPFRELTNVRREETMVQRR